MAVRFKVLDAPEEDARDAQYGAKVRPTHCGSMSFTRAMSYLERAPAALAGPFCLLLLRADLLSFRNKPSPLWVWAWAARRQMVDVLREAICLYDPDVRDRWLEEWVLDGIDALGMQVAAEMSPALSRKVLPVVLGIEHRFHGVSYGYGCSRVCHCQFGSETTALLLAPHLDWHDPEVPGLYRCQGFRVDFSESRAAVTISPTDESLKNVKNTAYILLTLLTDRPGPVVIPLMSVSRVGWMIATYRAVLKRQSSRCQKGVWRAKT